ncbi:multicopper oxidase domain-containing protein [Brachybacterium paraconglomeratum]|uniref:multicopper oxidase domain-containing protein n=1 Tax=Brachybacterium paraconglomeratum TaxID=173362 RepID=UPI0031E56148
MRASASVLSGVEVAVGAGVPASPSRCASTSPAHSFHIHDVQFRILTVDDAPPRPELAGPKDTIYLLPKVRYRLLVRFADYADPAVPYMYHCHMLTTATCCCTRTRG